MAGASSWATMKPKIYGILVTGIWEDAVGIPPRWRWFVSQEKPGFLGWLRGTIEAFDTWEQAKLRAMHYVKQS